MKLADIKGEKAFEVIADLLTPIGNIAQDEEVIEAMRTSYIASIQVAMRKHPKDMQAVIAILELQDPETFEITLPQIPKKIIEIANDPDVRDLFTSQGQVTELNQSGSATENTAE